MRDVLKSQLFQLKRDITLYLIFIVAAAASVLLFMEVIVDLDRICSEVSAGTAIITGSSVGVMMAEFFVLAAVPVIMGRDYSGGMIHCDVLSGHSRTAAFAGRLIPAVIISAAGAMFIYFVQAVPYMVTCGWGSALPFSVFMQRMLITGVFALRMCSEAVLVTVICRKIYLTYLVFVAGAVWENSFVLSSGKISRILAAEQHFLIAQIDVDVQQHFDGRSDYTYIPGSFNENLLTIAASALIIGAVCMMLAYNIFKNDDM